MDKQAAIDITVMCREKVPLVNNHILVLRIIYSLLDCNRWLVSRFGGLVHINIIGHLDTTIYRCERYPPVLEIPTVFHLSTFATHP